MAVPKTGDHGGQCVAFARNQLKPNSGIRGNANTWYDNTTYCNKVSIQSKCAACWSGGSHGCGHVGVVYSYDPADGTFSFMDSNFALDEKVQVFNTMTESQMKARMPSEFTFQGYVTLKA